MAKKIDTLKDSKHKELDQFYTSPYIAKNCLAELFKIINKKTYFFIEPSAGFGSFSSLIPNSLAFDIDPKNENIIKKDFLQTTLNDFENRSPICFFGNPPFGKNSSLAVKFFNHSAKYAEVIAFILPKTFRKQSIHDRLNLQFHLQLDMDLPKNSFLFKDVKYDVPCCFQVWIKKDKQRKISKKIKSKFFIFTNKSDSDFGIRRVGGRSGKAFKDMGNLSETSNYFVKLDKNLKKHEKEIIDLINSINFQKVVNSTAGVRSLSKNELIQLADKEILKFLSQKGVELCL